MKYVLLILILCSVAFTVSPALSLPDSVITGRWVATEGVARAPWTFDLVVQGTKLTGTVSQGYPEGRGRHTGTTPPTAIADGRIDGNTITFSVTHPRASNRRIEFKGRIENDQIAFDRDVVILGAGPLGRSGLYGKDGAKHFVAKRVSNQPVLSSTSTNTPSSDARRTWRARHNVSGRWVAQGVPNGPWTWELRMAGRRVTGTVKQGGESSPMEIFEGALNGSSVFFKVKSPDGARTIAFTGLVNGEEMTILRVVEGPPDAEYGSIGVFDASAPPVVLARREPGTMIGGQRTFSGWRRPQTNDAKVNDER
jgi:hypothetical protein